MYCIINEVHDHEVGNIFDLLLTLQFDRLQVAVRPGYEPGSSYSCLLPADLYPLYRARPKLFPGNVPP